MHPCTGTEALYRPGVTQKVGRGTPLLFFDHGTRREWGVSVTPRPLFTAGKDLVPIVQKAVCSPGPVWTGAENLALSGFDPRTFQLVESRYTDWATGPTKNKKQNWIFSYLFSSSRSYRFLTYLLKVKSFVLGSKREQTLVDTFFFLSVWPLTTHIWVVPHR